MHKVCTYQLHIFTMGVQCVKCEICARRCTMSGDARAMIGDGGRASADLAGRGQPQGNLAICVVRCVQQICILNGILGTGHSSLFTPGPAAVGPSPAEPSNGLDTYYAVCIICDA